MRDAHHLPPDLSRQAAAGCPVHRLAIVVSNPDGRCQMARESDEPSVAKILRGARLAPDRLIGKCGTAARPVKHCGVEHVVQGADTAAVEDLLAARRAALEQHLPSAGANAR